MLEVCKNTKLATRLLVFLTGPEAIRFMGTSKWIRQQLILGMTPVKKLFAEKQRYFEKQVREMHSRAG